MALTEEEQVAVAERQAWLEHNVLGTDPDTKWWIYEQFGGIDKFWQVNLWDYLGIEK